MMRSSVLTLAFMFAASCAHTPATAQEDARAEEVVARIIVEALAPASYGDWAYDWGALSARVSQHMHWHLFGPDARELEEGAVTRRTGWISVRGQSVGISAFGDAERVTHMTFELRDGQTAAVLDALRAAGTEAPLLSAQENSSNYEISVPGRDLAQLTSSRICTPEGARAARRCRDVLTLRFAAR